VRWCCSNYARCGQAEQKQPSLKAKKDLGWNGKKNLETDAQAVILERGNAWRKGIPAGSSMIGVQISTGFQLDP